MEVEPSQDAEEEVRMEAPEVPEEPPKPLFVPKQLGDNELKDLLTKYSISPEHTE